MKKAKNIIGIVSSLVVVLLVFTTAYTKYYYQSENIDTVSFFGLVNGKYPGLSWFSLVLIFIGALINLIATLTSLKEKTGLVYAILPAVLVLVGYSILVAVLFLGVAFLPNEVTEAEINGTTSVTLAEISMALNIVFTCLSNRKYAKPAEPVKFEPLKKYEY